MFSPMQKGFTALGVASQNGHHKVASLLIKEGAVVDFVTKVIM